MRTDHMTQLRLLDDLDRPTAWPAPTVPVLRTTLRALLLDLADLRLRVAELEARLASASPLVSSPASRG